MRKDTVKNLIEYIIDCSDKNALVRHKNLEDEGFSSTTIDRAIRFGYVWEDGTHYTVNDKGYTFLLGSKTYQISKNMLKHTVVMKRLSWWILGFTIINLIFFITQVFGGGR